MIEGRARKILLAALERLEIEAPAKNMPTWVPDWTSKPRHRVQLQVWTIIGMLPRSTVSRFVQEPGAIELKITFPVSPVRGGPIKLKIPSTFELNMEPVTIRDGFFL